ncbi:MAG: hypothetical protein IJX91_00020 [Clostridia bacterium]|nr:hypothetical protein [Clostridia bacterium]
MWVVLLILTIGISVALAAFVLPQMYLRARHAIKEPTDRGIKKVLEKGGQSLVFQPVPKWRKYIKQYVLAERWGKKELMCKLDPELSYISYDVVLFNNRNKVFDVLTVKELIENKGYTKVLALPEETSYVSVVVNQADTNRFPERFATKTERGDLVKFLLLTGLLILMEVLCIKVCCANVFGGVFRESVILDGASFLLTLLVAAVLIVVNLIVSCLTVKIRNAKKIRKE